MISCHPFDIMWSAKNYGKALPADESYIGHGNRIKTYLK